jgi:adenylate kinase family enzyme
MEAENLRATETGNKQKEMRKGKGVTKDPYIISLKQKLEEINDQKVQILDQFCSVLKLAKLAESFLGEDPLKVANECLYRLHILTVEGKALCGSQRQCDEGYGGSYPNRSVEGTMGQIGRVHMKGGI